MSLSGAQKRKLPALKKEKEAENQSSLSRWIKKQNPSPCELVQQISAGKKNMKDKIKIPRCDGISDEEFRESILPKREPVIITGLDIGLCKSLWTVDYLSNKIGDKQVKVHVSKDKQMDFIKKNFIYKTISFRSLIKRASEREHEEFFLDKNEVYYLRALGDDPRGRDVSDFKKHYSGISDDIIFPAYFEPSQYFSSVFRIGSSGCQLWTHYDIMDNMLIQVKGRKRVVLFNPQDTQNLYLNGDKSEIIDIDNPDYEKFPKFKNVMFYEGFLEPGDVIFIPALWMHNVISLDFGIAVNVFWKNLDNSFYNQKDPYGNRDLVPAEKALQSLETALKSLKELPKDYSDFYHRRILSRVERSLNEL
ncbi:tRNA wybutosine-synthesizing protein 5-like isoform X3 [Artemia franciscana]|uniref:tRNA wybutosine-synthesizing protein 5-like isoform X3 n=1 Tax=Artemia franciscana TaxID=6661 RepID=UPI0032DA9490